MTSMERLKARQRREHAGISSHVGYQPQRGHGINRGAVRDAINNAQKFAAANGYKTKAVRKAQGVIAAMRALLIGR